MPFFFVLTVAAFLANCAVILFLFQLRAKDAFVRPMILLYICLAGFNFGLSLMISSPDAPRAWFYLFLMRPFLFFLPPCFLWTAFALAGRPARVWLIPAFGLAAFMTLAAGAAYLSGSTFFIREMQSLPWGYLPRAGPGAALGLGGLMLLCVPAGLFVLFRAARDGQRLAGVSSLALALMFTVWWAGLFSNAVNVAGIPIFPLGSIVDAVMSFVITAYLHRRSALNESARGLFRMAGMLASLCPGLLVTWVFLEFVLPNAPAANGLVGLITAGVALFAFHRWFRPADGDSDDRAEGQTEAQAESTNTGTSGPLFTRLQSEYGLTYQEARICEELHAGRPRAEIIRRMNVTSGTFRNHLSEVYRKTVDRIEVSSASSRDKWQRLTVFLHKIAES